MGRGLSLRARSSRRKKTSSCGNRGCLRRDRLEFGKFHEELLGLAVLVRLGQLDQFHARNCHMPTGGRRSCFCQRDCTISRARFVNILKLSLAATFNPQPTSIFECRIAISSPIARSIGLPAGTADPRYPLAACGVPFPKTPTHREESRLSGR